MRSLHPGVVLANYYLEEMGLTQAGLAARMGVSRSLVNAVVKGKRRVTVRFAQLLADALGTSAELWLNMQAAYDDPGTVDHFD